jgi:hypothetical protein
MCKQSIINIRLFSLVSSFITIKPRAFIRVINLTKRKTNSIFNILSEKIIMKQLHHHWHHTSRTVNTTLTLLQKLKRGFMPCLVKIVDQLQP